MIDAVTTTTQWAMHPAFLDVILKRSAIEGMIPDGVRKMASALALAGPAAEAPEPTQENGVYVLPIVGMLAPQGMFQGGTSYDMIIQRVGEAADDRRVGTIILDIRSPGGTVWGCEEAATAILQARAKKPMVAVASPYCFSAAYWLATQASTFYATGSGEVGSVGVRSGHTDMSGFENLIGMKTTLIASSPDKIAGHQYAPLTDLDRAEIQSGVDASNRRFAIGIAKGRGIRLADVASIHGTGKTFSASKALARGAIDGIGSLRDVLGRQGSPQTRLALMRRQAALMEASVALWD